MPATKLAAWQNIAGEFERMDDVYGRGIYTWGRPVYVRSSISWDGWDHLKWNSLKMRCSL